MAPEPPPELLQANVSVDTPAGPFQILSRQGRPVIRTERLRVLIHLWKKRGILVSIRHHQPPSDRGLSSLRVHLVFKNRLLADLWPWSDTRTLRLRLLQFLFGSPFFTGHDKKLRR